jgi:aminopeptidase N
MLGVPCPYPKYDIGFVPRLSTLAVSMPGLMLVSEGVLARMADPRDDFAAVLCAHEVAHLWFGCHVAPGWWDDLWQDEAIATYVSYEAIEDAGLPAPWIAFCYREKERAYDADALPSRQPVSSPVATAAEAYDRPTALHREPGRPGRLLVPGGRAGPARVGAGVAAHRGREHAAGHGGGRS